MVYHLNTENTDGTEIIHTERTFRFKTLEKNLRVLRASVLKMGRGEYLDWFSYGVSFKHGEH